MNLEIFLYSDAEVFYQRNNIKWNQFMGNTEGYVYALKCKAFKKKRLWIKIILEIFFYSDADVHYVYAGIHQQVRFYPVNKVINFHLIT